MMLAYAKINLGLYVVSRRPDGYHNIETVLCRTGVADRITFHASSDIMVTSTSPAAPSDQNNICFKAARMLRDHLGTNDGVHIHIEKLVPVGAGLGGGSSDAATVLKELPAFWNRTAEQGALTRIALALGSDVPFFLQGGAALARGRGEELRYFDLDIPFTVLLCNPAIHVATQWAYSKITPGSTQPPEDLRKVVTEGMQKPGILRQQIHNDFESVVFATYPAIRELKEAMLHAGAVFALMSGSGSTVFGFFPSPADAEGFAQECQGRGYKTFVTPPHFGM